MKKSGILNSSLSKIVSSMGHKDKLVVCDCGLPIPKDAELVDLALTRNIPGFVDTLRVILEELEVEKAIIANEMASNTSLMNETSDVLKDISIEKVPHDEFKNLTQNGFNVSFVRTGEATPFANIILVSGVTFE